MKVMMLIAINYERFLAVLVNGPVFPALMLYTRLWRLVQCKYPPLFVLILWGFWWWDLPTLISVSAASISEIFHILKRICIEKNMKAAVCRSSETSTSLVVSGLNTLSQWLRTTMKLWCPWIVRTHLHIVVPDRWLRKHCISIATSQCAFSTDNL